jgi:hypothetical protein
MSSLPRWSLVSSVLLACGRADAPVEDTEVGTSGIVVDASDASGRAADDGTTTTTTTTTTAPSRSSKTSAAPRARWTAPTAR